MFKKFILGLLALLVVVLVVGMLLPSDYEVTRSTSISASPAQVHAHVGDLNAWPAWSPWTEDDPTIQVTVGDPSTGVGAHQSWSGESGSGELTFSRCSVEEGVRWDMTFDDQFESVGEITYEAQGEGTLVTWHMTGDNGSNPVAGYFAMMMDSMVGPMFELGLSKLKTAVEGG